MTGAGVSSDLHVDTNSTHFWMVLIHGQKRWKIFSRDQRLLLSPRYDESLDPVFDEDPIRDPEALADSEWKETFLDYVKRHLRDFGSATTRFR